MSGRRASPSLEVFTDRVHEQSILAQAAADLDQLLTAAAGLKRVPGASRRLASPPPH